jgi:predicted exporter
VQKEIFELPDTDRIQKARAIAEQLRDGANNRVRLLELAKEELEAEAARRQAAAAESEATATAEEIARAAEIAERERLAAEGGKR